MAVERKCATDVEANTKIFHTKSKLGAKTTKHLSVKTVKKVS